MINNIKSLIFDCDGVILNSNKVKRRRITRLHSLIMVTGLQIY